MGIVCGGGGVQAGTILGDVSLMDSLCVMRLMTPAVWEKGLDLLDGGGGVGLVLAYSLAVAGLLAAKAASFLQQAIAQGGGMCGSSKVLAVHDGAVDHYGDRGRGSGIAKSWDKVRHAGWHSGMGGGRGMRGGDVGRTEVW